MRQNPWTQPLPTQHQGFPQPLPTPPPAGITATGRKSLRAAFCDFFLVLFFSQETLSRHSQPTGGCTRRTRTPGSAPRSRLAPIPCAGIIHKGPFPAFPTRTGIRQEQDAEAGCAVPSRVLPRPCVPRRVPKHGSVPQPHVPLHQRLCRAVPRRAAACPCPSVPGPCPCVLVCAALSERCRRVPAAPGRSLLTPLPSRVMNRPP